MSFFVKVCCIQNIQETIIAQKYGINAVGLVGQMPSGPGPITLDRIRDIIASLGNRIETFLLSSALDSTQLLDELRYTKASTIQIVDKVDFNVYSEIRSKLKNIKIVQVIHIEDESNIQQAKSIEPLVDMILLDSGKPGAEIKSLGGTGQTHNWDISKAIVNEVEVPIILAGGLNPNNVKEAIAYVNPFGVDVCSGLRNKLNLNEQKLRSFTAQIRLP